MSPSRESPNLRVVLETPDPPSYPLPVKGGPLILSPSEACSSQAVDQTLVAAPGLGSCRRPTWESAKHAASWGSAVLYSGGLEPAQDTGCLTTLLEALMPISLGIPGLEEAPPPPGQDLDI